jgi:hypothetical protein
MLIDTKAPILDISGKPFKEPVLDSDDQPVKRPDGTIETRVVTLGIIMVRALCNPIMGEDGKLKHISPDEMRRHRWPLANRIEHATLPVELTVDEAAKIKKLVAEMWPATPTIYCRVDEAIEAAASGPKAVKKDKAA